MYHASDLAVHPHTFPCRGQTLPQALWHHHERLEGASQADFNSPRRAEVIQPGTIQTGELSEATLVSENKLSAINFAPEVTSYKVISPEVTSAAEPSSASRPQRLREPSAKALEAIATNNIQEQIEDEGEQDLRRSNGVLLQRPLDKRHQERDRESQKAQDFEGRQSRALDEDLQDEAGLQAKAR